MSSSSPCAACKFLRRKCTQGCVFAPYFPPEQPTKFSNVHRVFGASNVAKLLGELLPSQREDAVNSLAYEAEVRLRDPVFGCVRYISALQQTLKGLQHEVARARQQLTRAKAEYAARLNMQVAPAFPYAQSQTLDPQGTFVTTGNPLLRHDADANADADGQFAAFDGCYDLSNCGGVDLSSITHATDGTAAVMGLHLSDVDLPLPKSKEDLQGQ